MVFCSGHRPQFRLILLNEGSKFLRKNKHIINQIPKALHFLSLIYNYFLTSVNNWK